MVDAVSDLRSERRDALIKTYRRGRAYESPERLTPDRDVEAVAIFTRPPDHVRHCTLAMNAGKHVICTVPAGMSLEECEQLREVKERTGRDQAGFRSASRRWGRERAQFRGQRWHVN